jgi:uncharacterized protein (TIGR02646 family)
VLRVTRPAAAPSVLESDSLRRERDELRRAVEGGLEGPPTRRAPWTDKTVRTALDEVFARKCAYCEIPIIDSAAGVVDHFRPAWKAINADGAISSRHYWWLATEWTNLFLSCASCNRYKANRFPVAGVRAEFGDELANEPALLLNPCEDEPDEHLTFVPDGLVLGDTDRGQTTIDTLALNRDALRRARRERASALLDTVKTLGPDADLVSRMLKPDEPFAAMCRQVLHAHLLEARQETAHQTAVTNQLRLRDLADRQRIAIQYDLAPNVVDMGETAKQRYFGSTKWIERIVLTNFRPIRSLSLDFSLSASGNGPWTVLLGENGTGKTSILQALALVFMGQEQRGRLMPDASRNLRQGARDGSVQVYFTGSTEPLVLRFRKGQRNFEAPNTEPVLLLGYGSTRLPSRRTTPSAETNESVVRVDNLFDPLLPMTDPTRWLMSLDEELFVRVGRWLTQLLALRRPYRLIRDQEAGIVELRAGRSRSTLAELSDGYQSMLILACDVMRTLLPLWENNLEQAEGIVLIDELGAHLHPRWRMRIVAALRGVLPRVQFIATTHDPLCLRGLEDGEVTVLRRDEKQDVMSISDLPSVKGLRVEQLLASDFFGLGSTHDPEVDDLYEEYYRLRGRRSLSKKDRTRLTRIERDLMELDQLGSTEQEQLVFRAAGDYIARRRASGDDDHEEYPLDDDIRQRLSQLWSAKLPSPEDEI